MDARLARRGLLRRGLALAALRAASPPTRAQAPGDPFTLGVAAGHPWPDGFVIRTRLAPRNADPVGAWHGACAAGGMVRLPLLLLFPLAAQAEPRTEGAAGGLHDGQEHDPRPLGPDLLSRLLGLRLGFRQQQPPQRVRPVALDELGEFRPVHHAAPQLLQRVGLQRVAIAFSLSGLRPSRGR
jgi:hypothetical protein